MCETNDELLESEHDRQLELADQLDLAMGHQRELIRQLEASRETVADYEQTICKFREVVTQLQTQNTQLSQSLANARRSASSASLITMTTDQSAAAQAEASALIMSNPAGKQVEAQTIAKVGVTFDVSERDSRYLRDCNASLHNTLHIDFLECCRSFCYKHVKRMLNICGIRNL